MKGMEQNAFDVLEEKVRKAADTVKRLRSQNAELEQERTKLRSAVQEMEKRVSGLEKQGKQAAAEAEQGVGEIVAAAQGVGVVGSQDVFAGGEGVAVQVGGLLVAAEAV